VIVDIIVLQNPAAMRPPIRPKTAPIVPSIRTRGIAGIRVIVFSSMVMHLRIQALVTVLCGYENLVLTKNVDLDVLLGSVRISICHNDGSFNVLQDCSMSQFVAVRSSKGFRGVSIVLSALVIGRSLPAHFIVGYRRPFRNC